jgi:hypothetical protein
LALKLKKKIKVWHGLTLFGRGLLIILTGFWQNPPGFWCGRKLWQKS